MSDIAQKVSIEKPRQARQPRKQGGVNWEKWGWMYMRASGVVLVVLIFGHLYVNLIQGEGIKAIDFAFVGGKLSDPFWKVWDIALLWLAVIHGANGMRTLVNDYAASPRTRTILKGALSVHRGPARARHARRLHLRPVPRRPARGPPARLLRRPVAAPPPPRERAL